MRTDVITFSCDSLIHSLVRGRAAAAVLGVLALGLGGCVTRTQPLSGYSSDEVWIAMQAVADSPSYDDWHIVQNDVYANDDTRSIEIYRELKRVYVSPTSDPQKQERDWRFQILLLEDTETQLFSIDFTARQLAVPAHVWDEADRYFAQVNALLGPPRLLIEIIAEPVEAAVVPVAVDVVAPPVVEVAPVDDAPVDIDGLAPMGEPTAEPIPEASPAL